jgi:hypothetical protein
LVWKGSSMWKCISSTLQSSTKGRCMSQISPLTRARADRCVSISDRCCATWKGVD